jgi:hypothetical protein
MSEADNVLEVKVEGMELINPAVEPRRWAEVHFGEAPLTDVRRVERLKTIAEALAANPGRVFRRCLHGLRT